MIKSRLRAGLRCIAAAAVVSSLLTGIAETPAAAEVTAVRGEACAYYSNVGLFGGPQAKLGCEPQKGTSSAPAGPRTLAPSVTLPPAGSSTPIVASDPDGAAAKYGPATIHGGKWPCEDPGVDDDGDGITGNCPLAPPPSGPQSVSTEGTTGEGGSVTSSAEIGLDPTPDTVPCWDGWGPVCKAQGGFGPFPVSGDSLRVECTANEAGVSGSTTFVNAELALSTDAAGNPVEFEDVPDEPEPNYTRHGVITNVGDVFSVVYNEQIVNSDGSLTVIGTHMYLFGPTAVGEVVRGKVTCGVTPNSVTPTDTVNPTCGTPVVKPKGPEDPTPMVPHSELVGTFDAGNGGNTGIQSIDNIDVVNGTVQVGDPGSFFNHLKFIPGQTGPLPVNATRTEEAEAADLPLAWSFDVTDAAGNTSHCRGVVAPLEAVDDSYGTDAGVEFEVPASEGVLANDLWVEDGPLTAGSASDPAGGEVVLNPDGSFTYTPDAGFEGVDTFTYTVTQERSDGEERSDTGEVSIAVGPVAPDAVDDAYEAEKDDPLTVAAPGVLKNDTDLNGDQLTAVLGDDATHGTLALEDDGGFTYTPDAGWVGDDTFTYTASDGDLSSEPATVTITTSGTTPPPGGTTTTTQPPGGTTSTTQPGGGGGGTTTTRAPGSGTGTTQPGGGSGGGGTTATTRAPSGGGGTTGTVARGALARTGSSPTVAALALVTFVLGALFLIGGRRTPVSASPQRHRPNSRAGTS